MNLQDLGSLSSPAQYLTWLPPSEGFLVPTGPENVSYHPEFRFTSLMEAVIAKESCFSNLDFLGACLPILKVQRKTTKI